MTLQTNAWILAPTDREKRLKLSCADKRDTHGTINASLFALNSSIPELVKR